MERPILTERAELAGIPLLHIRPRHLEGAAPTVLFFHGWSSNKENQAVTAEALACEGYRVIVPDSIHHGERGALPVYDGAAAARYFWPTILQTVAEAGALTDAAVAAGWTDPDRIGVSGHSMGGFIASGVTARYNWVKVTVLHNGCPCYVWAEEYYRKAAKAPPPTRAQVAHLQEHDPEFLIARIAPRPLLLLHGSVDAVVPPEGARRFVQLARPYYQDHPERLAILEQERLNHYVTTYMIEQMRQWFCRFLPRA